MQKQREDAAKHLTKRLFAAEQAVDDAICKISDLVGYMPMARQVANLSAVVGQDAISEAAETLSAMTRARAHLVATHHRLADVRDQIGLREMGMGSTDMKPPVLARDGNENIISLADNVA
tara:strand:- start:8851 stop:9210 length:360 start_codon:yes stop_codon:yes gene_type:complete